MTLFVLPFRLALFTILAAVNEFLLLLLDRIIEPVQEQLEVSELYGREPGFASCLEARDIFIAIVNQVIQLFLLQVELTDGLAEVTSRITFSLLCKLSYRTQSARTFQTIPLLASG